MTSAAHGVVDSTTALDTGISAQLAELVQSINVETLPDAAIAEAKRAILDGVGVALAAWRETWVQAVLRHGQAAYPQGRVPILGGDLGLNAVGSCLVNGTLVHALDYDDTAWSYVGHPTAVLLPVCLAVGADERSSGGALVAAYVAGFEVAALVGRELFDSLAPQGWHLTSVIGVFAAAAAAASLLGLPSAQIPHAFGIAASQSGGLKVNFGTPTKPLHAGLAARAGLEAALLARHGVTASHVPLEGRFGFFSVLHGTVPEIPLDGPLSITRDGIAYKKYPTCTGTHPAVDAAIGLRATHSIDPHDIRRVRCTVTPEVLDELLYPVPADGHQARFSLPFAVAGALARGQLTLDDLDDAAVNDPLIRGLMSRCETSADEDIRGPAPRVPAARVEVELAGGRLVAATVETARGNPGNKLSTAELKEKFEQCARSRLAPGQITELADALLALERLEDASLLVPLVQRRGGG